MTPTKDYIENIDGAERRMFDFPLEYRKEGTDEFFEGVIIRFNDITDLSWFTEEVEIGAFDEVMSDDVRGLFNHDPNYVLGRNKAGTMKLTVSNIDARYSILYNPADPDHVRVMEKVKRGDVSQSSYAFTIKDAIWETRDGKDHRKIKKFSRWFDVAPVTYPANPNTTVAKRSFDGTKKESEERENQIKKEQAEVELEMMRLEIPL